ncbi:MAG TPA: hypothetical protein VHE35_19025 [Kofleriaceae bacterium]|nr:hypothetical protein [Kofleriaceae bacterium]
MRLIAAAIAISLVSGCSYLSVRGPTSGRRRGESPACTVNHGVVVLDAVMALAGVMLMPGGTGARVTGGVMLGGFGSSALYGWQRNGRCSREQLLYDEELAEPERREDAVADGEPAAQEDEPGASPVSDADVVDPGEAGKLGPRPEEARTAAPATMPPAAMPPAFPVAAISTREAAADGADDDVDADDTDDDTDDTDTDDADDADTDARPVTAPPRDPLASPTVPSLEQRWRDFWRRLP